MNQTSRLRLIERLGRFYYSAYVRKNRPEVTAVPFHRWVNRQLIHKGAPAMDWQEQQVASCFHGKDTLIWITQAADADLSQRCGVAREAFTTEEAIAHYAVFERSLELQELEAHR